MEFLTDTYYNKNLTELNVKRKRGDNKLNATFLNWVVHDGSDYLFKHEGRFPRAVHAEVFCSFLAKEYIKVPCVEVCYANDNSNDRAYKGCLVKSYMDENVVAQFNLRNVIDKYCSVKKVDEDVVCEGIYVDEVLDIAKYLCSKSKGKFKLDPNLKTDLTKIVLFDLICAQRDREFYNIELLAKKNEKGEIILGTSPMMDNGFSFYLQESLSGSLYQDVIETVSYRGADEFEVKKQEFIEKHIKNFQNSCFKMGARRDGFGMSNKSLYIKLAKEIVQNAEIGQVYKNFKNLDIHLAIEQFEEQANITLSPGIKFLIECTIETNIQHLQSAVESVKENLDKLQLAEKNVARAKPLFIDQFKIQRKHEVKNINQLCESTYKWGFSAFECFAQNWLKWATDPFNESIPRLYDFVPCDKDGKSTWEISNNMVNEAKQMIGEGEYVY